MRGIAAWKGVSEPLNCRSHVVLSRVGVRSRSVRLSHDKCVWNNNRYVFCRPDRSLRRVEGSMADAPEFSEFRREGPLVGGFVIHVMLCRCSCAVVGLSIRGERAYLATAVDSVSSTCVTADNLDMIRYGAFGHVACSCEVETISLSSFSILLVT